MTRSMDDRFGIFPITNHGNLAPMRAPQARRIGPLRSPSHWLYAIIITTDILRQSLRDFRPKFRQVICLRYQDTLFRD